ncbi:MULTISPECIES: SRPBCC family protein [unclassified Aureimonas]|uniref:SRPBCC family protein n=1 Tax=unclassified Aureimonas TaxID=2615206 RepID=UPI000ACF9D10|nr:MULTISPECIES: SRPBCC family protein [unclassified Aureimonas]
MTRRLFSVLMALLLAPLLWPTGALAHGPTRQKVTESVEIAAPPAKVWAKIKEFGDMSWHPDVASTNSAPGNVVKTTRLVVLKSGGELTQELYKYDDAKMTIATLLPHVDVKVMPVNNYSDTITVKPGATPETSVVEWRSAFYRGYPNNDPPPELNEAAAIKAVTDFTLAGLNALKASVEAGG